MWNVLIISTFGMGNVVLSSEVTVLAIIVFCNTVQNRSSPTSCNDGKCYVTAVTHYN